MIVYAHALEGIIALMALGAFIFGPLQWVSTDAARQHLFVLRDQLFDIARGGRIEFSSEEYRLIRAAFDRQIQFAHLLSFWRFVVLARTAKRLTKIPRAIEEAIARIEDEKTRGEVKSLVEQMNRTVILMIFAKSPLLWCAVAIALVVAVPVVAIRKLSQHRIYSPVILAKDAFQKLLGRSVAHFAPLIHDEVAGMAI
jgi:hypothetical protein